jgi:hypothetical protein
MNVRSIVVVIVILITVIIGCAWFFTSGSESARFSHEANAAVEAAETQARIADAKAAALLELTKEPDLATGREAIVAASREASAESMVVFERYRLAANQAHAVVESAKSETVKKYWRFRRDILSKLAEAAKASAGGYAVWQDPAIADRKMAFERMTPFEDEADAAQAEAERLTILAKAFQAEHRREL